MYDGLMDYVFISSCVPTIDVQDVLISIPFFLTDSFFSSKKKQITFFFLPLHAKIGNMAFFCVSSDNIYRQFH